MKKKTKLVPNRRIEKIDYTFKFSGMQCFKSFDKIIENKTINSQII